MSKPTLLERITGAFRQDATSAEIDSTFTALIERETEIRARLREISEVWSNSSLSNSAEQQVDLTAEVQLLQAELAQVLGRATALLTAKDKAREREAPAIAAAMLKGLEAKVTTAEKARLAWETASTDLKVTMGSLGEARELAKAGGHETKKCSEDVFNRVAAVLRWIPEGADNSNHIHRAQITRLSKQRSVHLDEAAEASFSNAWKSAGLTNARLHGVWSE